MAGRDRAASPYCATTRNTHEHPGTSPSNVTNKSLEVDARWNSQVARQAHNPKVSGSNPPPAPMLTPKPQDSICVLGVAPFTRPAFDSPPRLVRIFVSLQLLGKCQKMGWKT